MWMRIVLVGLGVLCLACGGVGSSGSEQATRMADYKAEEAGVPCRSYGDGDEIVLDDFNFQILAAETVEAETRLPWIKNSEERADFQRV